MTSFKYVYFCYFDTGVSEDQRSIVAIRGTAIIPSSAIDPALKNRSCPFIVAGLLRHLSALLDPYLLPQATGFDPRPSWLTFMETTSNLLHLLEHLTSNSCSQNHLD